MFTTLPTEILHMIFKDAFEHDPTQCYHHDYRIETYSVPVSTISRRFRAIALSLPELWSCIHIDFAMPVTRSRSKNRNERLRAYLLRSQPRDISVHLRQITVEWNEGLSRRGSAYAPLFLQPSRWSRFTITTVSFHAIEAVIDALPRFEHLHTFHLESMEYHSMGVTTETPLPRLKSLQIRDIMLLGSNPSILQNLTDLVLCDHGFFFMEDLCQIGDAAPHLTHLVLFNTFISPVHPLTLELLHPPPPVTFNALRTLTLHHPRVDFEYILAWLVAPQLEKLELFEWRSMRISDPAVAVTIDFVSSIPALRELCIVDSSPGRHEIAYLQPVTSSITTLDLSGTDFGVVHAHLSGTDFGVVHAHLSEGTWCPLLETITVTKVEDISKDRLVEFVRMRAATINPLTEVKLGERLRAELMKDDLQFLANSTKLTVVEPTSVPRYWVNVEP